MPGHGERIIETYEDWFLRINKRVQRLERRVGAILGPAPDPVPYRMQAGSTPFSIAGAATQMQLVVTFAAGRFTTAPIVTAAVASGTGQMYAVTAGSTSATSMTLQIVNRDAGSSLGAAAVVVVHWHAVQMTAVSGAG